jgi:hypothetical protein
VRCVRVIFLCACVWLEIGGVCSQCHTSGGSNPICKGGIVRIWAGGRGNQPPCQGVWEVSVASGIVPVVREGGLMGVSGLASVQG